MVKQKDIDEWLKPIDVQTGNIVTIVTEGSYEPPSERTFGRETFQIRIRLPDGRTKRTTMNKTSRRALAKVYGDESRQWVDREAMVRKEKQNMNGELRDCVYYDPMQGILSSQASEPNQSNMKACPICGISVTGTTEQDLKAKLQTHLASGCK